MKTENINRFLCKFNSKNSLDEFSLSLEKRQSDLSLDVKPSKLTSRKLSDEFNTVILESDDTIDDSFYSMHNIEAMASDDSFGMPRRRKSKIKIQESLEQWNLEAINWEPNQIKQLIQNSQSKNIVKIAIIDSGINDHFELKECVVDSICFAPNIQKDETNDNRNHGTPIAGIIASLTDNGGINGVFPGVQLMNIKVTNNQTAEWWISAICEGIIYATDKGAKVINISWNYEDKKTAMQQALINPKTGMKYFIDEAINFAYNKGVIIVFSLGDVGKQAKDLLPNNIDKIIVVGACNKQLKKASWSNKDKGLDVIYAPGDHIKSIKYNDKNGFDSNIGSSFAAAHVTGAIGLMLLKNSKLKLNDIRSKILTHSIKENKIRILNIKDTLDNI